MMQPSNVGPCRTSDIGSSVLPIGSLLMIIDNTAAIPIAGTFTNLADGGIITSDVNNFQASYEGGDGNDLTLTVVPSYHNATKESPTPCATKR